MINEQSDVQCSRYRLSGNLVPVAYTVELMPFLSAEVVVGAVDIKVRVRHAYSSMYDTITLHSLNLQLRAGDIMVSRVVCGAHDVSSSDVATAATRAKLNRPARQVGLTETWYCVELQHHATSETVQMRFDHSLPGEEGDVFVLHISRTVAAIQPVHLAQGVYRGTKDPPLLLTHMAPCNARRVLPCFDEPALLASWSLSLVVPLGCTAVANSPIEREEAWRPDATMAAALPSSGVSRGRGQGGEGEVGVGAPPLSGPGGREADGATEDGSAATAGYKKVVFYPTPPLPSCAVGFVVGSFASLEKASKEEGILCRVLCDDNAPNNAGWYALDLFTKAVDFFHRYFLSPVAPLRKLDMVVIDTPHDPCCCCYGTEDNRSPVSRTESWGMIVLPDAYALVTETTSLERRQRIARLIGFEVCRHWLWVQWWSEAWLLNGLCVYLGYAFADAMFPNWGLWSWFTCTMIDAVLAPEAASLSRRHTHARQWPAPATQTLRHAYHDPDGDACAESSLVGSPRPAATRRYRGPRYAGDLYDEVLVRRGAMAVRTLANLLGRRRLRGALRKLVKRRRVSGVAADSEMGFTCDAFCACVFEAASSQPDPLAPSDEDDEEVRASTGAQRNHDGPCNTQDDTEDRAGKHSLAALHIEYDDGSYSSPCQRDVSGFFACDVVFTPAMVNAVVSASCGAGCPYIMARVTERGYVLTRHVMPNAYNGVLPACAQWQSERRACAALDPLSLASADVSFTWQPSAELPYLSDSTAVLLSILQFNTQGTTSDPTLDDNGHHHHHHNSQHQVSGAAGQSPIGGQRGGRVGTGRASVNSDNHTNDSSGAASACSAATVPQQLSTVHAEWHGDGNAVGGGTTRDHPTLLTQVLTHPSHPDALSRSAQGVASVPMAALMRVQLMVGSEYVHVPCPTRTRSGETERYSSSLSTTSPASPQSAVSGVAMPAVGTTASSWPLCYFNAGGSGALRCDYDMATWRRIIAQAAVFSDEDRVSITMTLTRLWSTHVGRFPDEYGDRCTLLLEWLLAITTHHNAMNCVLWDYITGQLEQMVFLTQNYLCHDVFCTFVCSLYTVLRQRGALSFFIREKAESFQARRHLTRATTIKVLRLLSLCGSPALASEAREVVALLLAPLTASTMSGGALGLNMTEYAVAPPSHCRPFNASLVVSSTPPLSTSPNARDAADRPPTAPSVSHTGDAATHEVIAATAPSTGATMATPAAGTASNASVAEGRWGATARVAHKDGQFAEERGDGARILCTSRMDFHDEDCARAGGIALQYLVESSRLPYWLTLAAVMAEVHHVPTGDLQMTLTPETLPALSLDGVAMRDLQLLARIAAPAFFALDDERVFGFMRRVLLAEVRGGVGDDAGRASTVTCNACDEAATLHCAPQHHSEGGTRAMPPLQLPIEVLKALYRNTHFIAYICEHDMPPSLLRLIIANGGDYCSNSNLITLLSTRLAQCAELAPTAQETARGMPLTRLRDDGGEAIQTTDARVDGRLPSSGNVNAEHDGVGDGVRSELREMLRWMEVNCTWMDYCCAHYDKFLRRIVHTVARTSSLADSDQMCGVSTPLIAEPLHDIHTFSMQSVSI